MPNYEQKKAEPTWSTLTQPQYKLVPIVEAEASAPNLCSKITQKCALKQVHDYLHLACDIQESHRLSKRIF